MKIPAKCPFCSSPMITDFKGSYTIEKKCVSTTHYVKMISFQDDEEIRNIIIVISHSPTMWANWSLTQRVLMIYTISDAPVVIPYFEPSLTNFVKLADKVKTYLLFS